MIDTKMNIPIPHSFKEENGVAKTVEILTEPETKAILQAKNVSTKQYLSWVIARFYKKAFRTGLVIAFLVGIGIPFFGYFTGKASLEWAVFFFAIVFPLFLLGAISVKNSIRSRDCHIDTVQSGRIFAPYYSKQWLLRYSSPKRIKKISDREWEEIRNFNVEKYWKKRENKDAPRFENETIEKLREWEGRFKRWLKISGIAFAVVVLPVILWFRDIPNFVSVLYHIVFLVVFVAISVSLCSRFFLKALISYGENSIEVMSRRGIHRYTGTMCAIWAIIFMTWWVSFAILLLIIAIGLAVT